ncbi:mitotic-spindle organizing gamma-tubulin ring associated-domain-containing protein [Fennellomyces sp. T-0311]|nr:mitotic-spindle organizing gamma-tubulin ring associated-domain-containing protein [Fennellomyces sp. T-0311]
MAEGRTSNARRARARPDSSLPGKHGRARASSHISGSSCWKKPHQSIVVPPDPPMSRRPSTAILLDMATMLDTGLDRDTLALCVSMCERGVNPEALAEVIKELRKQKEAKATAAS